MTDTEQQAIPEIQQAFQLFLDTKPDAQVSAEDAEKMAAYVVDKGLDPFRAGSYWRAYEWLQAEPKRAADEEERRAAQERQRRADRAKYLRPSSEDRSELLQNFRQNQRSATRPGFTPDREYTQAEMDAMSGDEYRHKILGVLTIEDKQSNTPLPTPKPEDYVYRAPRRAQVVRTELDRILRTANRK